MSDVERQLILFADRVEALEKERDIATDTLKAEAGVTTEFLYRNKVLAEDLEAVRLVVDEQVAEIEWLRAREIPEGWRIADHPHYGTVLTTNVEDGHGNLSIHRIAPNGHGILIWVKSDQLTFCDEAPAPEQEMDAR